MIELLLLYWEFLKVGLFTFGGGYGAIPLIRDTILSNPEWGISLDMFQYIVGVAESTPGPIMVNTATYIGTTQAGILGGVAATLGAITPSFVIILLIAKFLKGFMEKENPHGAGYREALRGWYHSFHGRVFPSFRCDPCDQFSLHRRIYESADSRVEDRFDLRLGVPGSLWLEALEEKSDFSDFVYRYLRRSRHSCIWSIIWNKWI